MPVTHEALYPISHDDMMTDFNVIRRYSEDSLGLLREIWLDSQRLGDNPSLQLMELQARPLLGEHEDLSDPYRVGVLIGTIVVRDRLQHIHESPDEVAMALSFGPDRLAWEELDMQTRRFALRQFFDTDVDVKKELYNTVEAKWQQSHVRFMPDPEDPNWPANDWAAVGMGDTLRLYERRYCEYTGHPLREPKICNLKPEPRLPELWTT